LKRHGASDGQLSLVYACAYCEKVFSDPGMARAHFLAEMAALRYLDREGSVSAPTDDGEAVVNKEKKELTTMKAKPIKKPVPVPVPPREEYF